MVIQKRFTKTYEVFINTLGNANQNHNENIFMPMRMVNIKNRE